MSKTKNKHDTSKELLIVPLQNGVSLSRPQQNSTGKYLSIKKLFELPLDFYFYDCNGTFQDLNENTAESCGFDSSHHARLKDLYASCFSPYALQIINNNSMVIHSQESCFLEERILLRKGDVNKAISIKMPWYNDRNEVIGVFGCSINYNK